MPPSAEHDQRVERTPANDGQLDTAYLAAALARAGRPATVRHLVVERIEGGRVSHTTLSSAKAGC